MADTNWIKLNRKIWDNFIWDFKNPKFGLAWIDMLLMANYMDKKILFDGALETVERGSFITSMVKLAERWDMDRKTVKRLLDLLQQDGMIVYKCTKRRTSIKIVKYDLYQSFFEFDEFSGEQNGVPDSAENGATEGTTDGTTETIGNTGFAGFDAPTDGQPNGHQMDSSRDINGTTEGTQHKNIKKNIKEGKESKKGKTSSLEDSQALFEQLIPKYKIPETLKSKIAEWIIYKAERKDTYKEQGMKALLRKIENSCKDHGAQAVCELIDECMASNWSGIIFDKLKPKQGGNSNGNAPNNGNTGSARRYGNYV